MMWRSLKQPRLLRSRLDIFDGRCLVLTKPHAKSVKIKELTRHFPLLCFAYASVLVRPMPERSAAFALNCIDDLGYPRRRQALVHLLDEVLLDRVGVEMQH